MSTPLATRHTPAWLEEVSRPGPNEQFFPVHPEGLAFGAQVTTSMFIMEDDTSTSLFTAGCGAYAGYSFGNFSNMTAVRAYAAGQHARAFAYSGFVSHLAGADAIDIEPGLASPGDAPAAYRAGIRFFYMSAGTTSAVKNALTGAGISLAACKFISAHYTGSHICGPGTCGYPQADATQFTSSYLGRSLDATLCPGDLFGPVTPVPAFPMLTGDVGPAVHTLQVNLNRWAAKLGIPAQLVPDSDYGPLTAGAVTLAQVFFGDHTAAPGVCDEALYRKLAAPVVPVPAVPAAPKNLKAVTTSTGAHATLTWATVAGVKSYEYQLEWYKPKFGWVLIVTKSVSTNTDTQAVAAATRFRYRVSSGTWSDWAEFSTS